MLQLLALAVCDLAACVVGVAGIAKIVQPSGAVGALTLLRMPRSLRSPLVVGLLGTLEIAVAVAVIIVGGPASMAALALAYAGFALVARRLVRAGATDCGCFGMRAAPVTTMHVVANSVVAVVAGIVTLSAPDALVDRLGPGLGAGLAYSAFAAIGSVTAISLFTAAAELASVRRSMSAGDG